jgi:hypothetical protein
MNPMPRPSSSAAALLLTALMFALAPGSGTRCAAAADLSQALHDNSYEIHLHEGELEGTGRAFLLKAVHGAQFVALGEEHNNLDIPPFTTALLRLLHEAEGFNYLALEQDPVMMQRVSDGAIRGDSRAINALAVQYLMGFTFDSDQELTMLAQAGALLTGKGRPIWGCDQAFGVTHVLDELARYAPDEEARGTVESLRAEAASAEAVRALGKGPTYMQSDAFGRALPRLRQAFAGAHSERAAFLLDALARSAQIYGYFSAGERGEIPGYYANNAVREDYLKSRFLAEYRRAEQRDGSTPKVLMKFGHYHLCRGLSPISVPSLGNFASDFARSHDLGFFSIAIVPFNASGGRGGLYGPFAGSEHSRDLAGFAAIAAPDRWTLLDLRPLREYPYFRALAAAEPEASDPGQADLRRLVYGFDALLMIGGSAKATHTVTQVAY